MKYKVGDKVRVREWQDMAKEYSVDGNGNIIGIGIYFFAKSMKKLCGKTVTIKKVHSYGYEINEINDAYSFTDEMFESPQLIIEHHGRTTVAHIGKRYGVARCNPDDKYDAMTGDILAVQRLYAKKKIISANTGECYGIVGTPSPFKDVNGNPLKVGDCVDDGTPHKSFIAWTDKEGFFVMGWAWLGTSLRKHGIALRKTDDYDHESYPHIKVIPCQQ